MSHGPTRIPTRGVCIYCGALNVYLTDEHVVPFSLGGFHILEKASCLTCADITKRFEQDVARELWGDGRNSYNAPSRRKKHRKPYIVLTDPNDPTRQVKIPYSDYPAAMVFYKMAAAGMLQGLPETVDISSAWQLVAIHNDAKAKDFKEKWGIPLVSRFRHVPESFARVIAKVGYCNMLCSLDPSDFEPICLPYILGKKPNLSYVVGGSLIIEPKNEGLGYILRNEGLVSAHGVLLIAKIRLFANEGTPSYHVIVGAVSGREKSEAVLKKLGNGDFQLPKATI